SFCREKANDFARGSSFHLALDTGHETGDALLHRRMKKLVGAEAEGKQDGLDRRRMMQRDNDWRRVRGLEIGNQLGASLVLRQLDKYDFRLQPGNPVYRDIEAPNVSEVDHGPAGRLKKRGIQLRAYLFVEN